MLIRDPLHNAKTHVVIGPVVFRPGIAEPDNKPHYFSGGSSSFLPFLTTSGSEGVAAASPGAPLVARLVVRKAAYVLDLGGKTPEVSPAPKGAKEAANGFGCVTLTTAPLQLKVVANLPGAG